MRKSTFTNVLFIAFFVLFGCNAMAQSDPENWKTASEVKAVKETTIVAEGNNSAKLVYTKNKSRGSSDREFMNQVEIAIPAGTTEVKAKCKIYHPDEKLKARYKFKWNEGYASYGEYSDYKTTGEWTEFAVKNNVPEGATSLTIGFRVYNTENAPIDEGAFIYIDDLKIEMPLGTEVAVTNGGFENWEDSNTGDKNYPSHIFANQVQTELNAYWEDITEGDVIPTGYLVVVNSKDNDISTPVDGEKLSTNLDLTAGEGVYYAEMLEQNAYFNVDENEDYKFTIFPFVGEDENIVYTTKDAPITIVEKPNQLKFIDFEDGLADFRQESVIGKSQKWVAKNNEGVFDSKCAYMNGYSAGKANENEDWLISTLIQAGQYDNLAFWFHVANRFSGDPMKVMVSSDYTTGNPNDATWTEIDYFHGPNDNQFYFSRKIDLSTYDKDIKIAFVYTSNDSKAATWKIDDLMISGEAKVPTLSVITPNGGESIEVSKTFDITWECQNIDGKVNIDLTRPNNDDIRIASDIDASEKVYTWTPASDLAIANDYKIKISSTSSDLSDESDAVFATEEPYKGLELVISEIMYNPPESGADSLEFVEIYNPKAEAVNLQGVFFNDAAFKFSFDDYTIAGNGYAVVAVNAKAMKSTFGIDALQWTSGGLKNGGEKIILYDKKGNVVDEVEYKNAAPWNVKANGEGHSLILCDLTSDNSIAENWNACPEFVKKNADEKSIYATPGAENFKALIPKIYASSKEIMTENSIIFECDNKTYLSSVNWIFEGGDPKEAEGSMATVNYKEEGKFDVTLTISNGCATESLKEDDMIVVYAEPSTEFSADKTKIKEDEKVVFSMPNPSESEDVMYIWTFEGAKNDYDETDPKHIEVTYPERGVYDVELMAMFGSFTVTESKEGYITVEKENVGLEELENDNKFKVYPQPAKKYLTISPAKEGNYKVRIMNIQGQTVKTLQNNQIGERINITDLNGGNYIIQMINLDNNSVEVKKLIIQ
ncbi:MAG: lamin tail domain-containing protein [Bacteroidales bacterium]